MSEQENSMVFGGETFTADEVRQAVKKALRIKRELETDLRRERERE